MLKLVRYLYLWVYLWKKKNSLRKPYVGIFLLKWNTRKPYFNIICSLISLNFVSLTSSSPRRDKSCSAPITQMCSSVSYELVPDSAVDGWWKAPVFTHHWKHKSYSSAHHCVWRAVLPKSWTLSTAQVLWSDTASIQRRCFIHEKEMLTESWYVEVMQSNNPSGN